MVLWLEHENILLMSSSPQDRIYIPPTRTTLRDAALVYLSRFSATEQSLRRVLERKVMRWAHRASTQSEACESENVSGHVALLMQDVSEIVREMVHLKAVDDEAFARARIRTLRRSGRSNRAVRAHLAAKGVAEAVLEPALREEADQEGMDAEFAAALTFARKRRVGPFALEENEEKDRKHMARVMGAFARAGFSRDICLRILETSPEEADDMIMRIRRDLQG